MQRLAVASLLTLLGGQVHAQSIPDITGSWKGTGTGTQDNCLDDSFNGDFGTYSLTVNITRQTRTDFNGNYVSLYSGANEGIREVGSIVGNIMRNGAITAQTSYKDYFGIYFDTNGHAEVTGRLEDNVLHYNSRFQDYIDPLTGEEDTCRGAGRAILTRVEKSDIDLAIIVPGINDEGRGLLRLARMLLGCYAEQTRKDCTSISIRERNGVEWNSDKTILINKLENAIETLQENEGSKGIIVNIDMNLEGYDVISEYPRP